MHSKNHNREQNLVQLLENRGPNAKKIKQCDNITFGGFVLWHQGTEMCIQPIESSTHILLLNGDMFNNSDFDTRGTSDTEWIFKQLSSAKSENELFDCFKTIEGPYSIIFYDKLKKTIYFARDSLGRNSLIIERNNDHFRLLSTSYNNGSENNTTELPPLGIYKVCNNDFQNLGLYPWRDVDDDCNMQIEQLEKYCNISIHVLHPIDHNSCSYELENKKFDYNFYNMVNTTFSTTSELYENLLKSNDIFEAITKFSELLENSVKYRVQYTAKFCTACLEHQYQCNHSKVAILFSGGIDCSILAVLTDKFVPKSDTIDLVNVAFESSSNTSNGWNVPDRLSAKSSFEILKDICPESVNPAVLPYSYAKIGNIAMQMPTLFSQQLAFLYKKKMHEYSICKFIGPVRKCITALHVMRSTFVNAKSGSTANVKWSKKQLQYIWRKRAQIEIIKMCDAMEVKWNFIEVNVSKEELYENLKNHIKHLIFPLNTVLDESIGCAFWFASRAFGIKDDQSWKSSARVVILGSGADELFGGYVRHKNAYNRFSGTEAEKQQNLLKELEKDWKRIPSRNLARDDRVISDNGKTPRAPFIEEHVVRFAHSLSPYQRCCFLLEDGIGDKLFLRLYGYHLGLRNSAFLKKRAIQFGSRIANKKQNAADRSAYL